jgi:hypothetical protein
LRRATRFALIAALIIAAAGNARAQTIDTTTVATDAPASQAWSFAASLYAYFVPQDRDYLQPTVTADHGWLHLEARYNYEDFETGSVWIGYNFAGGETWEWALTPILGAVFGQTSGVAPGLKASLAWRQFELYSEGEHVIDTEDVSNGFFYNWSELSMAPTDTFRFGLSVQRTQAYESDRDVQSGILAAYTVNRLNFSAYVFNPFDDEPIFVLAASLSD